MLYTRDYGFRVGYSTDEIELLQEEVRSLGRLVGRLVSKLVGWSVGWLVGWLAGCLLVCQHLVLPAKPIADTIQTPRFRK
jgi:hypothetical protein